MQFHLPHHLLDEPVCRGHETPKGLHFIDLEVESRSRLPNNLEPTRSIYRTVNDSPARSGASESDGSVEKRLPEVTG